MAANTPLVSDASLGTTKFVTYALPGAITPLNTLLASNGTDYVAASNLKVPAAAAAGADYPLVSTDNAGNTKYAGYTLPSNTPGAANLVLTSTGATTTGWAAGSGGYADRFVSVVHAVINASQVWFQGTSTDYNANDFYTVFSGSPSFFTLRFDLAGLVGTFRIATRFYCINPDAANSQLSSVSAWQNLTTSLNPATNAVGTQFGGSTILKKWGDAAATSFAPAGINMATAAAGNAYYSMTGTDVNYVAARAAGNNLTFPAVANDGFTVTLTGADSLMYYIHNVDNMQLAFSGFFISKA